MTTGTETLTLSDFLLARIAEDERDAECVVWDNGGMNFETYRPRVLAECEAKRRIIKGAWIEMGLTTAEDWLFPILALPYADHPDFREEWRPQA